MEWIWLMCKLGQILTILLILCYTVPVYYVVSKINDNQSKKHDNQFKKPHNYSYVYHTLFNAGYYYNTYTKIANATKAPPLLKMIYLLSFETKVIIYKSCSEL